MSALENILNMFAFIIINVTNCYVFTVVLLNLKLFRDSLVNNQEEGILHQIKITLNFNLFISPNQSNNLHENITGIIHCWWRNTHVRNIEWKQCQDRQCHFSNDFYFKILLYVYTD